MLECWNMNFRILKNFSFCMVVASYTISSPTNEPKLKTNVLVSAFKHFTFHVFKIAV